MDYFVLDSLANDLEDIEHILNILNSPTEYGWRDQHPEPFTRDEIIPSLLRGIMEENIEATVYSEQERALVDAGKGVVPDIPIDEVWFRLTKRGRRVLNDWEPPPFPGATDPQEHGTEVWDDYEELRKTVLERFSKFTRGLTLQPGTQQEVIEAAEFHLGLQFPQDYVEFMLASNGAEGSIGANGYVRFWPVEELVDMNDGYSVLEYAPGFVLFGSNGGGEAFAFDGRTENISLVELPFIPMTADEALVRGKTFTEFLEYHFYK